MTKPLALIIEDDLQLSDIFTIALQPQFETIAIMDGLEASERLGQLVPAIIVLDLNLPGVSGGKLLAQIRNDERLKQTRVLLATADDRQADSLSHKADVVLLKPISPVQLSTLASRFAKLS